MKIWIDFINSPQVTFWVPFIKDFEKDKHAIILTCRDSGNTVELLKLYGLNFHIVGHKAGKGMLQKIWLFSKRMFNLYMYIRKNKPDVAASQSSYYQPLVSRTLGIPCLYTNDNEHAKGNLFGFLFAKKVVMPMAFKPDNFVKKWPLKSKILFYPGVKEAIYLSQRKEILNNSISVKNSIFFRTEPWSAQYYSGPLNFFDKTLLLLSKDHKVIILPRDSNQVQHYKQEKFKNIHVAEKPLTLNDIVAKCKLLIGAGGSMTRELAVLGIPVISIYQEELLKVDRYLAKRELLQINPDITYDEIKQRLVDSTQKRQDKTVIEDGKDSYKMIKDLVYNL